MMMRWQNTSRTLRCFFFSSRRRHTRFDCDWSSDVCSSDLVYFDDVTNSLSSTSAYCIAHVRPFTELATDLANNTVASYNFITPNLTNDMHDGTIADGDTWLAKNVPVILNSTAYKQGGVI